MSIIFQCITCDRKLRVPDDAAGKKARCKCGQIVAILPERDEGDRASTPLTVPSAVAVARVPALPALKARPPQGITKDAAEALVRSVAEQTGTKAALKMVGNFKPKKIANARATFAKSMKDDEVPLAMVDTSFLTNGKAGILLTNRALYSSTGPTSIQLAEILAAAVEQPTALQIFTAQMLGLLYLLFAGKRLRPELFVNGEVLFAGQLHADFWSTVLLRLAKLARDKSKHLPSSGSHEQAQAPSERPALKQVRSEDDLSQLIAAAICSGQTKEHIMADFANAGAGRARVARITDEMVRIHSTPRTSYGLGTGLVAGGLCLALVGLVVTIGTSGEQVWWICYGPVIFGLGLAGHGWYRLLNGPPPLQSNQLVEAWEAN